MKKILKKLTRPICWIVGHDYFNVKSGRKYVYCQRCIKNMVSEVLKENQP